MRIDSRKVEDLRPDVAANVRVFIDLMAAKGFPVGISSTYRNDEQQAYLYAQGRTRAGQIVTYSPTTTFHGARLAFDIFQNTPDRSKQYNDPAFWSVADDLLAKMGFSRLKNEKCHAEWSAGGKYSGGQVRAGVLPPPMTLYGAAAIPATVKPGSTGEAVRTLQGRLNALGFPCGTVDGDFGQKTLLAVKQFQAAHGLTVDGVVGPATWKVLLA